MQTNQTTAASTDSSLTVWQSIIFDDDYQETESQLFRTFEGAIKSLDLSRVHQVQHLDVSELSVADLALLLEFMAARTGGASLSFVYNNREGKEETINVSSPQVNC